MSKKLVKISRSFAMKKNLGNYQTADFWMMQEVECPEEEAEKKSEEIYQFVKSQVLKSYNDYGKVAPSIKADPEEEYFNRDRGFSIEKGLDNPSTVPMPLKVFKPKPGEIEKIIEKTKYRAKDREGGKEKIVKEELTPY